MRRRAATSVSSDARRSPTTGSSRGRDVGTRGGAGVDQPPEAGVAQALGELEHGHPRSAPSVAWATCQPASSSPTRSSAGILTSFEEHLAEVRLARWPGGSAGRRCRAWACRAGSRRCRAAWGVRVGAGQQQAPVRVQSPLAQTFWPSTTQPSPSRRAVVRRPARSEPASGSENPWHQISPSRMAGRWRRRCSSVPATSRVDGRVVDRRRTPAPAAAHRGRPAPGRARPARRRTSRHPTPPASGARPIPAAEPLEPVLLEGGELLVGRPRSAAPASRLGTGARHQSRPRGSSPCPPPGARQGSPRPASPRRRASRRRRCSSPRIVACSSAKPAGTASTRARPRCRLTTRLVPARASLGWRASRSASRRASGSRSRGAPPWWRGPARRPSPPGCGPR